MNDQLGLAMLGAEWKNMAFEDFFKIYLYGLYMCISIHKEQRQLKRNFQFKGNGGVSILTEDLRPTCLECTSVLSMVESCG